MQHLGNNDKSFRKNVQEKWRDLRVDKLKMEWLNDKRILDVGCGEGIADILIAVKFQPKLIIGIDIDHRMVKKSITNMQKAINDQEQQDVLINEARNFNQSLNKNDVDMTKEYEAKQKLIVKEKEEKYRDLLKRIDNLPLSHKFILEGKLAQIGSDPSMFLS